MGINSCWQNPVAITYNILRGLSMRYRAEVRKCTENSNSYWDFVQSEDVKSKVLRLS